MLAQRDRGADWSVGKLMEFLDISNNFVEALRRAMRVGGTDSDGNLEGMTQLQMREESGVGRSTIAKYLSASKENPANPTLDVLYRLAGTLGLPVAFLLMSADDWVRICHAIDYLNRVENDGRFLRFSKQLTSPESRSSNVDIAEAGLLMAQMLGLIPKEDVDAESSNLNKRRTSIAATCSAPPMANMNARYRPSILTICSIIGASSPRL